MKKHNLGRIVELLIASVVALMPLMLGLSMFGYKPVHSNAGTMPAGTLIPSPILLNPVCVGTGCSSGGSGNLSVSGTPATGQVAQFVSASQVAGATLLQQSGVPAQYDIPYYSGSGSIAPYIPSSTGEITILNSTTGPATYTGTSCISPMTGLGVAGAAVCATAGTTPLQSQLTGGFATATSIAGNPLEFMFTTAAGASAATGTITFSNTAPTSWNCLINDQTATVLVEYHQTGGSATTAVITPFLATTGLAVNFNTLQSHILRAKCGAL